MDGKSQAWRDAADKLLESLARENKFIVSDMVIIFLESAGYGLTDYSPLGGVFKRARDRGIISRIDRPTKQALWLSSIYRASQATNEVPVLYEGAVIGFKNFGELDHVTYKIAEVTGNCLRLERHE